MKKIKLDIQKFGASVSLTGSDGNISGLDSYISGTVTISTSGDTWNQGNTAYYQINGGSPQYFSIGKNSTVSFNYQTGPYRHNEDGSLGNQTISVYVRITSSTNASANISVPMQTIPRTAVTDSVIGTDVDDVFKVNYTTYASGFTYKLRISLPLILMLERIDYNTSGAEFTLSSESLAEIYSRYPGDEPFDLGFAVETYNGSEMVGFGNEIVIQATKMDKVIRLFSSNEWKKSTPYVRANGEWKKATPYIRMNNEWKRGK